MNAIKSHLDIHELRLGRSNACNAANRSVIVLNGFFSLWEGILTDDKGKATRHSHNLTRDSAPLDASVFVFLLRDLSALLLSFGTICCDTRFRLTVRFDDVVADSLVILVVVCP